MSGEWSDDVKRTRHPSSGSGGGVVLDGRADGQGFEGVLRALRIDRLHGLCVGLLRGRGCKELGNAELLAETLGDTESA